jgi:N-ethylmaleimide reductase
MQKLFSPFQLGRLALPNRIVMAPMTRSRSPGNTPGALVRQYYSQRATAGLIITEGTAPAANGLGYARIPGAYSQEQLAGWRDVVAGVHQAGGRIALQLMHVGRIAHALNLPEGARTVAPSAVKAAGTMYTDAQGLQPMDEPAEMSEADIREARDAFVTAARGAIDAGFDAIELHGANGYLLEQFLNPHSNRRADDYGGDVARRSRFVREVAEATAAAIGADRVGIRLSPYNTFNDQVVHDEVDAQYKDLAASLKGLLYVHLVRNPHAGYAATAQAVREIFGGPIILNGGFGRDSAEAALEAGEAELVSFARPFISNPDLVSRFANDQELAKPNPATFYTPGAEGYTDYPALA